MSEINKKRLGPGWIALIIFLPLIDLVLLIRRLLQGNNVALFNPKGLIAQEQYNLMVLTTVVLLAVVIPTLIVVFFIAWKYRESNPKAVHSPTVRSNKGLVFGIWLIPTIVMLILAGVMIPATHKLVPQKPIAASTKPITVQVVSLRWKWLFIYPEQQIATVNFLQVPVNTPIEFELTADAAPMSSFWIPNLGGQLYTMTGMTNRLNLVAETPGDYPGSSAEINGAGFAGMKFTARASSIEEFEQWAQKIKQSPDVLDATAYENLLMPSKNNTAAFYSAFEPNLYDKVIMKYRGPNEEHGHHE